MGGIKPHRAKCSECGNGMIKRSNNQKYCASCRRIVITRHQYEYQVRNGLIKNPGIGARVFKPRRAKCTECGNGMIQRSGAQKYCASCRRIVEKRDKYEANIRNGYIKNPGTGSMNWPHVQDEDHPMWKGGGRDWQIKNFRGKECERCGSEEEMHLHHRDLDPSNWKPENLETLCAPCHREEHPPVWLGA